MTTNVDEIILKQQETMPEKLDTIIDNLKERTNEDSEKVLDEPYESIDDKASATTDHGRKESAEKESEESNTADRESASSRKNSKESKDSDSPTTDTAPDEEEGIEGKEKEREGSQDTSVDEYGEPIADRASEGKPETLKSKEEEKIYTNSDVNRMIRERMERMKVPQAQRDEMQERIASQVDNFQSDPNSEGDWLTQLKQVIKEEITAEKNYEVTQRREEEYRQQLVEDQKVQHEFENKFTDGIARRSDFKTITKDMPITNSMMLGIRAFKDPAGFIYAASKNRPDELKRIASIRDPLSQAAELGKLEAFLTRQPKKNSKAPPIINRNKGDVSKGQTPQRTVDDIIAKQEAGVRR